MELNMYFIYYSFCYFTFVKIIYDDDTEIIMIH